MKSSNAAEILGEEKNNSLSDFVVQGQTTFYYSMLSEFTWVDNWMEWNTVCLYGIYIFVKIHRLCMEILFDKNPHFDLPMSFTVYISFPEEIALWLDFLFNALIFIGWGGAVWDCLKVDLDCFSNCANKSLPTFNSTFFIHFKRKNWILGLVSICGGSLMMTTTMTTTVMMIVLLIENLAMVFYRERYAHDIFN